MDGWRKINVFEWIRSDGAKVIDDRSGNLLRWYAVNPDGDRLRARPRPSQDLGSVRKFVSNTNAMAAVDRKYRL